MTRISLAQSVQELEEILIDIECDKFENEPWTKEPLKVSQLRNKYVTKLRQLNATL